MAHVDSRLRDFCDLESGTVTGFSTSTLRFSPVIPRYSSAFNISLIKRTSGQSLGTFQQAIRLRISENNRQINISTLVFVQPSEGCEVVTLKVSAKVFFIFFLYIYIYLGAN